MAWASERPAPLAKAHRDELRHNWERAERGEPVAGIDPLE
jgi:hypothetical protein